MKLSLPRYWSPSSRFSFRVKEEKAPAVGVGGARFEGRVEGADLARAFAAVGARFEAEDLARFLFGQRRVPGEELGVDRVDRAGGRRRHQAAFAGEEVELEVFEGNLGQVFEVGGQLAGFGVGLERADQLDVDPEARGDHEEAVLVAGLVRRCRRSLRGGPLRAGVPIAKVPILELIGAVGRALGAEVGLGFGAVALPVGGVGVDREARRQGDGRRFDLRGRGGEAQELGGAELDVEPRGGVGFGRWSGWRRGPV